MKQEIIETTQQNLIPEKKSDLRILRVKYFYELYLKEKRKYSPSLFCIDKTIRLKRKRIATLKEFKKVIYEYFKIYFFELYMNKLPMYFCLTGIMRIVTYSPWARILSRSNLNKKSLHQSSGAFGLFWYYRPGRKAYYMVELKKLSGSTNIVTKIEKIFKENHNQDLLPTFTEERKKVKNNKIRYRCIPI